MSLAQAFHGTWCAQGTNITSSKHKTRFLIRYENTFGRILAVNPIT